MLSEKFCIVLTTVNSQQNSEVIINTLLEKRLSACIQTVPINSHYVWKDKVCRDDEILLVIKTQKACYKNIEKEISALHTYDVPQIIQIPVTEGSNAYLHWLELQTQTKELP